MSTRYLTGTLLVILGGFVVVATQAFAATPVSWIAFGIAIATVAVSVLAQLDRSRGTVQRVLDAAQVAVGGLLMAFALTASGTAVRWLSFALALGTVALGFIGLTLHEISNWRAAHRLGELRWLPQQRPMAPAVERSPGRAA
jgi:hypothetical protein